MNNLQKTFAMLLPKCVIFVQIITDSLSRRFPIAFMTRWVYTYKSILYGRDPYSFLQPLVSYFIVLLHCYCFIILLFHCSRPEALCFIFI